MAATRPPSTERGGVLRMAVERRRRHRTGRTPPAGGDGAAATRAADDPRPRPTGISDRTVMASRSWPRTATAVRAARWVASWARVAPSPSVTTDAQALGRLDVDLRPVQGQAPKRQQARRSCRGPRLAVDAESLRAAVETHHTTAGCHLADDGAVEEMTDPPRPDPSGEVYRCTPSPSWPSCGLALFKLVDVIEDLAAGADPVPHPHDHRARDRRRCRLRLLDDHRSPRRQFRAAWMGTWATGLVIAGTTSLWRALFHWLGSNEGDAPEVRHLAARAAWPPDPPTAIRSWGRSKRTGPSIASGRHHDHRGVRRTEAASQYAGRS